MRLASFIDLFLIVMFAFLSRSSVSSLTQSNAKHIKLFSFSQTRTHAAFAIRGDKILWLPGFDDAVNQNRFRACVLEKYGGSLDALPEAEFTKSAAFRAEQSELGGDTAISVSAEIGKAPLIMGFGKCMYEDTNGVASHPIQTQMFDSGKRQRATYAEYAWRVSSRSDDTGNLSTAHANSVIITIADWHRCSGVDLALMMIH